MAETEKSKEEMLSDIAFQKFIIESGVDVGTFSEEALRGLYTDYEGERDTINKERQLSQNMREEVNSRRGGTQAGDVFVADSPWEGVASLGAAYADKRNQDKASESERELSKANAAARREYAVALRKAVTGGNEQQQVPGPLQAPAGGQPPSGGNPYTTPNPALLAGGAGQPAPQTPTPSVQTAPPASPPNGMAAPQMGQPPPTRRPMPEYGMPDSWNPSDMPQVPAGKPINPGGLSSMLSNDSVGQAADPMIQKMIAEELRRRQQLSAR